MKEQMRLMVFLVWWKTVGQVFVASEGPHIHSRSGLVNSLIRI